MKLYLMRHGEAMSKQEDPERPLTSRGFDTARRVANFLGQSQAVSVAEIRHSTKRRARETAETLAAGLGLDVPVAEVANLEPLDDVSELAAELKGASADLMLVGHLPHLDRLASLLVAGNAEAEAFDFSDCGVLHLRREGDGEAESRWVVEWMLTPQLLTGGMA